MAPSSPLRGSLTLQDENDTSGNVHHARHMNLQEFEEASLSASSLSFADSSIRCGASPLNNSFNQSATVAAYVVSKATSATRNRCQNYNQEQTTTVGLSSSPLNTSTRRKRTTTTAIENKPHQREEQEEKERHDAANIIIPAHLLLSPQRFITNNADDHEQSEQQQQQYFNPYDTIISPTAAHHNRQSREIENDDELTSASRTEQPEQHRRGLSGVHEFFDDDDDLLLFDDAAQEVEELRQIADERQQAIFDLQAELSEAREVHKELARKNEILQSESRSLRSAMADEGSILGGLLLGSPSSSIAARFLGNGNGNDGDNNVDGDVDDATFSSPRRGGLGSERNIKSYYQQLWLLQQQLQKSGNSILLQSPNSATRKTFCDAETSCGGDDDEYLSVSMRTVKKLPFDENENDDDQQQQKTNESATSPLAVDVNVNQVGGLFYLLPPKSRHSHLNHRRTQQRNKNKAKLASAPSSTQRHQYHQRLSSFFSTTNARAAMSQPSSAASCCCSQCGNSADRLRGGKVDYKLMAKNSTAYGRSKFSFFRFLFDW